MTDEQNQPPATPQSSDPAPAAPTGWRRFVRPALRHVERGLAVFGLLCIVYFLCFNLSYMVTPSMAPTLQAPDEGRGDWVLTEKVSGWFCNPRRWEVVTFRDKDGMQLMKRVVALPGESVSLPDVGQLQIDGKRVELPKGLEFLQYLPYGNLSKGAVVPAGDGWYVLGDQLRDSFDSRYQGSIPGRRILGRAWMVVWPPSRMGFIR